jgi:hypothetical protein
MIAVMIAGAPMTMLRRSTQQFTQRVGRLERVMAAAQFESLEVRYAAHEAGPLGLAGRVGLLGREHPLHGGSA